MVRGERIDDPEIALFEIRAGHHLMHEKCVLSAPQLRTWPVAKLLEAVSKKRLYIVRRKIV